MDRRVFEPRPNGNDARRRSAISLALLVLIAGAFWLFFQRMTSVSAPAGPHPTLSKGGSHAQRPPVK